VGCPLWPWQPCGQRRNATVPALQQVPAPLEQAALNLTRACRGRRLLDSQLYDTWPWQQLLARHRPTALSLIDVGTGGGFPGTALGIAYPRPQSPCRSSVEPQSGAGHGAMAHSLAFEAQRVMVRWERAETTGQDPDCRGRFHWGPGRAVAARQVVAEYF